MDDELFHGGAGRGNWNYNGSTEGNPLPSGVRGYFSDARVREFEETNTLPAAMERRVQAYLKKRTAKR